MQETIPTAEGRHVLIRRCAGREALQLAIIGKQGGMVEAVSFDATQLPGVVGALQELGERITEPKLSLLEQFKVAEEAAKDAA